MCFCRADKDWETEERPEGMLATFTVFRELYDLPFRQFPDPTRSTGSGGGMGLVGGWGEELSGLSTGCDNCCHDFI